MELEVEFEEGDILIFNDQEWKVDENIVCGGYDLIQAGTGELRNFNRKELQDMVEYSGKFTRIREEYIDVFEP